MTKWIFSIFLFIAISLNAQVFKKSINDNWFFHLSPGNEEDLPAHEKITWKKISIPHTWNSTDVLDDEPGYFRGIGWYKKIIEIDPVFKNQQIFLYFEGVSQTATVF
ncbi:MAG: hypothetical protein HC906_06465 [Bacteroidales bacterium]|nr:hypothetical protein [Bacteroidales bacterium]